MPREQRCKRPRGIHDSMLEVTYDQQGTLGNRRRCELYIKDLGIDRPARSAADCDGPFRRWLTMAISGASMKVPVSNVLLASRC
jgi:hypothetical protein